jgi:hypothetical protein
VPSSVDPITKFALAMPLADRAPEYADRARYAAPFFILGCRRSGTSLVSQLLDNHSRLAVYHETQYYPLFHSNLPFYGDLRRATNLSRLIGDLRESLRLQGVDPPSRDDLLINLVSPTFEGVLATLLGLYAHRQGKTLGGDKTPDHHAYLAEILKNLSGSPVIFVLRDPRDTVRSIRKAFDTSLDGAIRLWNEAFLSYKRFSDKVHPVRYEELVRNPAQVLDGVCALLGEKYEPSMLRFFERVPERFRSLAHVEKLVGPIDVGSIGSFRELPRSEVQQIEAACAEGMEALGYAFSSNPISSRAPVPPDKLGWAAFLLDRLRYYRGRPDRMRRGWFRWKILFRARARYILTLVWLRRIQE